MTTIEKIHAEFDSAQDRLLSEALQMLNQNNGTNVVAMSERLKAVGFSNTPVAKAGEQTKEKLVKSTEQAELIQYYQYNYPFLKFLTEEELDRICAKYKLIYAPVANYVKDVPEKNLRDIEVAQKLKSSDYPRNKMWSIVTTDVFLGFGKEYVVNGRHFSGHYEAAGYLNEDYSNISSVKNFEQKRSGLFIAAPKSHFKGKNLSISFYEIKDPIVFRYVRGGIQVLTKWGAETEDPALILPKNN